MKTLVIIGAGFSGTVTAIQFLKHCPPGVRVILINRSGGMARGLAYGTNSAQHLLNVPVGNMTALVDEPDSFQKFCQKTDPSVSGSSFVPRKLYGDYLSFLLDSAVERAENVSLDRLAAEVHSLRSDQKGAIVELADGEQIRADHVVLAFGHFAPLSPQCVGPAISAGCYQQDPWDRERLLPGAEKPVLLIGAGLTALDVALNIDQCNSRPIYMLSRRGLQPLAHRNHGKGLALNAGISERLLGVEPTASNYLREVRSLVKAGAVEGRDWRDFIAALRPATPALWARLPEIERRRFLRHLQPYWDVHRHRVAPETHERFLEALGSGRIISLAGRIKEISPEGKGVRVSFQRRGSHQTEYIDVGQVINCTGPNSNLRYVDDRLITQLRDEGLLLPDLLGLGLHVDEHLAVKNADGNISTWLSYIGPMLKADLWEATAVPELRELAKNLACRLADGFRQGPLAG
ncbi:FAD/NAD(P)-binding protein [Pseudomonas protegens]